MNKLGNKKLLVLAGILILGFFGVGLQDAQATEIEYFGYFLSADYGESIDLDIRVDDEVDHCRYREVSIHGNTSHSWTAWFGVDGEKTLSQYMTETARFYLECRNERDFWFDETVSAEHNQKVRPNVTAKANGEDYLTITDGESFNITWDSAPNSRYCEQRNPEERDDVGTSGSMTITPDDPNYPTPGDVSESSEVWSFWCYEEDPDAEAQWSGGSGFDDGAVIVKVEEAEEQPVSMSVTTPEPSREGTIYEGEQVPWESTFTWDGSSGNASIEFFYTEEWVIDLIGALAGGASWSLTESPETSSVWRNLSAGSYEVCASGEAAAGAGGSTETDQKCTTFEIEPFDVDIKANGEDGTVEVGMGETATLSWTSEGPDSRECFSEASRFDARWRDGNILEECQGSEETSPITQETTYTIVSSFNPEVGDSVTVTPEDEDSPPPPPPPEEPEDDGDEEEGVTVTVQKSSLPGATQGDGLVTGPGIHCGNDCQETYYFGDDQPEDDLGDEPETHMECNSLDQCVEVSGPGDDECGWDGDCDPGDDEDDFELDLDTHMECQSGACVEVDGEGDDECSFDSQCIEPADLETHMECQSGACVEVDGEGDDECSFDSQCIELAPEENHMECNFETEQCVEVDGEGADECSDNWDCTWHLTCQIINDVGQCTKVFTPGADRCQLNSDCPPNQGGGGGPGDEDGGGDTLF